MSKIVDEVLYVDEDNNLTKFRIMVGADPTNKSLIAVMVLFKNKNPILKANGDSTVFDCLKLNNGSEIIPINSEEIELSNLLLVSYPGAPNKSQTILYDISKK